MTDSAGYCLEAAVGSQKLSCTSMDVRIAEVINVTIWDNPDDPDDPGCKSEDDTVTFTATWVIETVAPNRYDIGIWLNINGDNDAKAGQDCAAFTLGGTYNLDCDSCGDLTGSNPAEQEITITASCRGLNGSLNIPYCTSWDNNAAVVCSNYSQAVPGTNYKCYCNDEFIIAEIPVPDVSEMPSVQPSKAPTKKPTPVPSAKPSAAPSDAPTKEPTPFPTAKPSFSPSDSPTKKPTPKQMAKNPRME